MALLNLPPAARKAKLLKGTHSPWAGDRHSEKSLSPWDSSPSVDQTTAAEGLCSLAGSRPTYTVPAGLREERSLADTDSQQRYQYLTGPVIPRGSVPWPIRRDTAQRESMGCYSKWK